MSGLFAILISFFSPHSSPASLQKNEVVTYLSLNLEDEQIIENKDIYIMNLNQSLSNNTLTIKDSNISNFAVGRSKRITGLKIYNTNIFFAKFGGLILENCIFENVHFFDSDLSFLNFKNCSVVNTTYKDTITYGVKHSKAL